MQPSSSVSVQVVCTINSFFFQISKFKTAKAPVADIVDDDSVLTNAILQLAMGCKPPPNLLTVLEESYVYSIGDLKQMTEVTISALRDLLPAGYMRKLNLYVTANRS